MLLIGACGAGAQSSVDWNAQKSEILTHYRDLIRIDTRAGKETKAVEYLRKVLEGEGIPTSTFALDSARANLVARLKGNGSKRPILILAHTDVVGVQPEKWPVDPFSTKSALRQIQRRRTEVGEGAVRALLTYEGLLCHM